MLVVEDENIIAWDIEAVLRKHGVEEVLCALNLRQARDHLRSHPNIAVALLDLRLGEESGEELIDELKERNIAIVLTTGYSEHGEPDLPTVPKPYSYPLLLRTILDALKQRG